MAFVSTRSKLCCNVNEKTVDARARRELQYPADYPGCQILRESKDEERGERKCEGEPQRVKGSLRLWHPGYLQSGSRLGFLRSQ